MSEILAEIRIRPRYEITLPKTVRNFFNLVPGDFIRFEKTDRSITICKSVTHKVNNKCGDVNGTKNL